MPNLVPQFGGVSSALCCQNNKNKLTGIYRIPSNTTIFLVVCLLILRHNYIFRPSMLAIFQLYMRNLSISYTSLP